MSGAWTKGPWQVANTGHAGKKAATFRIWRNDPDQPRGDDFRNAGYFCIAPHVRGEANAHLIAAAPDMADALDMVDAMFSHPGQINKTTVREVVRAVLAKARGEAK